MWHLWISVWVSMTTLLIQTSVIWNAQTCTLCYTCSTTSSLLILLGYKQTLTSIAISFTVCYTVLYAYPLSTVCCSLNYMKNDWVSCLYCLIIFHICVIQCSVDRRKCLCWKWKVPPQSAVIIYCYSLVAFPEIVGGGGGLILWPPPPLTT